MEFEFKFPDVGEGIHEGNIVKWLVKEGDFIEEDAPLVEMETAKAIVEIPSPKSGKILKRIGKEGDTIKVDDTLVVIDIKEEIAPRKGISVVGRLEEAPMILPKVRKLAEELKIDIAKIKGTGLAGMITEEDVKKASQSLKIKKQKKYDMWGFIEHIPLHGIRKTVAEHMAKSAFTAVHVTHFDKCDITDLTIYREMKKKEAEAKGIKLTFMPFFVKAVIAGLKEYPFLNASLKDDEIILKKYYNIAFAVDTQEGLMAPVIKGADKKDIFAIAKEIQELAEKCRNRTIDLMDLQGSSFTISNVGLLGGTFFTPIINYPESAILGVAAIKKEPVVKDSQIVIRDILNIGVSFDHRLIDGAMAARFLKVVMNYLENKDLFQQKK